MATQLVITQIDGEVGYLSLNRPHAHNAVNTELVTALTQAAQELDTRPDIKVVVLQGLGPSFCAGFDLTQFNRSRPEEMRAGVEAGHQLVQTIANMRATTVAAVHGHCIGGGMVLMMACNFRYAAANTTFRLPEADLGIPLAWGSVPWMVREAGALFTSELILSGRNLEAQEALDKGLINAIYANASLHDHAAQEAKALSRHSSLILEATKRQIVAAQKQLCADNYGFADAHLLYSALCDQASIDKRDAYLAEHARKKTAGQSA